MRLYEPTGFARGVETAAAWLLGILWILPLAYAVWTAFHPAEFSARFVLTAYYASPEALTPAPAPGPAPAGQPAPAAPAAPAPAGKSDNY